MGNIALPALSVRPMEDPLDQYAKMAQIKALMQGQQLSAAELQSRNLQNQQLQMSLQGQQRVMEAMKDPAWNPTDIDSAYRLLQKHSVPVANQENVIKFISTMRDGLAKANSENLKFAQDAHSFFDDQFQSVKSAPDEKKQSAYQDAISAAKSYAANVPDPNTRQNLLAEIAQAPALYDSQFIDNEHAKLRTMQYLVEEGLKTAQTREASEKARQAGNEADLATAKIPGAKAQSAVEQQNASLTPQGRALAGNLFYQAAGGDAQAKQALQLETSQKVAAAQAGTANVPDALKGVAPHLVGPAAAAAEKAGNEYSDAVAAARDMKTFVDLARSGNKIAYAYSPTEGVLTLNTARGVKRVNMPEIASYGGAGSALDRVKAFLGKQTSGASIPDSVLNDMESLHQAIAANAQSNYTNKLKNTNSTYGSNFRPVNMGGPPAGATMRVPGSDGKMHWSDGKSDLGVIE